MSIQKSREYTATTIVKMHFSKTVCGQCTMSANANTDENLWFRTEKVTTDQAESAFVSRTHAAAPASEKEKMSKWTNSNKKT